MTDTSLDMTPATRTPGVLRPAGLAVLASAVLTAILLAKDTNDGPAWRVGLVLAAAVIVCTALVFGLVVRRVQRGGSARAAAWASLILGILTVVSLGAFWLALPGVFAVAALVLARDARDRRPFRGAALATAGAALAVLGAVAAVVISVMS